MKEKKSLRNLFDRGFIKENHIMDISLQEKIYSKKNDVYKIKITFASKKARSFVLKQYSPQDPHFKSDHESFFYTLLIKSSLLSVPNIFYKGSTFLILDFICGETLLDYMERMEASCDHHSKAIRPKNSFPPLLNACIYIDHFHKALRQATGRSYVLDDLNLRNFLVAGQKLYRVDFEDCRQGDREEDFGRFIAFVLTYDLPYSAWKCKKAEEIRSFLKKSMDLDMARIDFETEKEIKCIKQRRERCQDPGILATKPWPAP